jgi:hypothetical protein
VVRAAFLIASVLEAELKCIAISATKPFSKQSICIGMSVAIRSRDLSTVKHVTNIAAGSESFQWFTHRGTTANPGNDTLLRHLKKLHDAIQTEASGPDPTVGQAPDIESREMGDLSRPIALR